MQSRLKANDSALKIHPQLKKILPLLLRITLSAIVLVVLVRIAGDSHLLSRFQSMQPGYLAAAFGALCLVILSSALRWQMLLHGYHIPVSFFDALSLYWASLFFMIFLPGSVGGDVIRSYSVARRHGRLAAVVLATLQERLAGLGCMLLLGIAAAIAVSDQIGSALALTLSLVQTATLVAVALALYPAPMIRFGRWVWQLLTRHLGETRPWVQRVGTHVQRFLAPAAHPLRLTVPQLSLLALALIGSSLFGIATYWTLSLALQLNISWLALCLVVPVVTLMRVLPISFNGIGVGEGAFVVMLLPFGVAQADALALSLSGLALHTVAGLVGGIFYLIWLGRGVRLDSVLAPEAEQ